MPDKKSALLDNILKDRQAQHDTQSIDNFSSVNSVDPKVNLSDSQLHSNGNKAKTKSFHDIRDFFASNQLKKPPTTARIPPPPTMPSVPPSKPSTTSKSRTPQLNNKSITKYPNPTISHNQKLITQFTLSPNLSRPLLYKEPPQNPELQVINVLTVESGGQR